MNVYEYISICEKEKPLDRIVTDGGFCAIFRTIACIGDSLSSGEFESIDDQGKRHYHDMYEYSWGQFIGRSCGSKVLNFSKGGMTAQDFVDKYAEVYGCWNKEKACQAYIIAMGVNDLLNKNQEIGSVCDVDKEDCENNEKTFAGYFGYIIQKIKQVQPRAKIFLVSMPKEAHWGEEKEQRKRKHRDLLNEFTKCFDNTYLIDLFEYSPVQDEKFYSKFWLGHMNPMGYVLTARMIESYIDFIIRTNPKEFNQVGFIGTDLTYIK